jgi:tetratricopeptide (TPR) repeat protein
MDTSKWIAPQLSPETIANLKKAAEFSPGNCDFIGIEAFFEWMAAEMPVKFRSLTRDELPPDTRQSIDGSIARLQELSESPDEKLAAKAFEYLGMLNFISGNSREAASDFRRAVALDPTRERSWDMQLAMGLKDPDFPDEAVAICKSRLKYNNSARNHLFLSKAYQHKNEWSEAAAEAEVAANLDTNYIIAPLMLAAIDLEQSVDANLLPKAKEQLDHAYALLGRMNSGSESEQRWREISLNGAILCGLLATPDSEKMAKQVLGQVLKYYPGDETAKAILEALPGEDTVNDAQDD